MSRDQNFFWFLCSRQCWSIPHLTIVQNTKGYVSLESLLWHISKCQSLLIRKKTSPFICLVVPLLVCYMDTTKSPSRHKTSQKPLVTDTGGLLKKNKKLLSTCSQRTASHSSQPWNVFVEGANWKEESYTLRAVQILCINLMRKRVTFPFQKSKERWDSYVVH